MMKSTGSKGLIGAAILLLVCTVAAMAGSPDSLPVELQLIWATNEPRTSDTNSKPVSPELAKMFEHAPYRWKYYYEVNRRIEQVPSDRSLEKIEMSKHCSLDIKYLGNDAGKDHMQVKLYGEGKLVSTHKEPLPLLLAGDAKNDTAWFVLIRKAPAKAVTAAAKGN